MRWVIGVAVSAVLGATAASADVMHSFKVGAWQGGAYSNNQTKQFNHCAATASYRSGVMMLFSVNKTYHWSIGFASNSWRLNRGAEYPLRLDIDGVTGFDAKAAAIATDMVEIKLADSVELFHKFRRGHQLKVMTAGTELDFVLTDTSKVLPVLIQCVNRMIAVPATAQSNPFVAPKTQSGPGANERTEGTMLLANILSSAGVTGFRLLGPDEKMPFDKAAAAYEADGMVGAIFVLPNSKVALKEAPATIIAIDAADCAGKFASGATPDPSSAIVRAFTSCQTAEGLTTSYYVASVRKRGGLYIFVTRAQGAMQQDQAKEVDTGIRTAAHKLLQ